MNEIMCVQPCLHPLSITIPEHLMASYVNTCNPLRAFSPQRARVAPSQGSWKYWEAAKCLWEQPSTKGGWELVDK